MTENSISLCSAATAQNSSGMSRSAKKLLMCGALYYVVLLKAMIILENSPCEVKQKANGAPPATTFSRKWLTTTGHSSQLFR
jgi:hypothetical protein